MKKLVSFVLAATMILVGSGVSALAADLTQYNESIGNVNSTMKLKLIDIEGHWAEDIIERAYELKLISGYEDHTFHPDGLITRAEFATILSHATKVSPVNGANPFADLKEHWAESAVAKLVAQNFIHPADYPNGFNPNTELTRYEMMKWIANGLMKSNASFKQAFDDTQNTLLPTPEAIHGEISAEKIPYIALVRGTEIVGGFEDGSLKPQNTTTRAEVAAILLRYMNVEGQDASSYPVLDELREIGTTGSNLISVSNYHYSSGSAKFIDFFDEPMTLNNNSGVLKVHRFIVVDNTSGTPKGPYAPLFTGERDLKNYLTFAEVSFTSNLESSDLITFSQGLSSELIKFGRIDPELAQAKGLTSIPMNSSELIKKGVTERFWMSSILRKSNFSYYLKTDKGIVLKIQNTN